MSDDKLTQKERDARNLDMLMRRHAGETYEQIGVRYHLTRERVSQIIRKLERKLAQ